MAIGYDEETENVSKAELAVTMSTRHCNYKFYSWELVFDLSKEWNM